MVPTGMSSQVHAFDAREGGFTGNLATPKKSEGDHCFS
jgi:hypothetical protein